MNAGLARSGGFGGNNQTNKNTGGRPRRKGGVFLCRDYPQATESYWLVSLDAERHIADLKKIAAAMHQDDRKRMFAAAKLTVRAYAKDPSDNNATRVHVAWKAVNDLKARSFLRQWKEASPLRSTSAKPTD